MIYPALLLLVTLAAASAADCGDKSGAAFDDKEFFQNGTITKIDVWSGYVLDAIQVMRPHMITFIVVIIIFINAVVVITCLTAGIVVAATDVIDNNI